MFRYPCRNIDSFYCLNDLNLSITNCLTFLVLNLSPYMLTYYSFYENA